MSTVRMCDQCGAIFSERQDGWGTYLATTVKRNKLTGRMEPVTEQLDACPLHAVTPTSDTPSPRLMGDGEVKQIAEGAETESERQGREDAAKQLRKVRGK